METNVKCAKTNEGQITCRKVKCPFCYDRMKSKLIDDWYYEYSCLKCHNSSTYFDGKWTWSLSDNRVMIIDNQPFLFLGHVGRPIQANMQEIKSYIKNKAFW